MLFAYDDVTIQLEATCNSIGWYNNNYKRLRDRSLSLGPSSQTTNA